MPNSDDDKYFQTLVEFEEGLSAYTVQPLDINHSVTLAQHGSSWSFGPVGRINVFVGATNAGKSRFLRGIAKAQTHQLFISSAYEAIWELLMRFEWLLASGEVLTFRVKQSQWEMSDGSPPVYSGLPSWAKDALQGIHPKSDYDLSVDAKAFGQLKVAIHRFLSARVINQPFRDDDLLRDGDLFPLTWIRNLMRGEIAARQRDEELQRNNPQYVYTSMSYQSLKFLNQCQMRSGHLAFGIDQVSLEWQTNFLGFWDAFEKLSNNDVMEFVEPSERFYIPTLRSAISLRDESGKRLTYDIFEVTTRQNYGLEESKGLQIFTGNRLYDTLKVSRNGTPEVLARLRSFERFLSDAFFEGKFVELVPLDESFEAGQHINVRVDGQASRDLHNLGDGINTLIILLYQLFMAKPGSWIFIEEPELNLHPGLQRLFLKTLLENPTLKKKQLVVFFTTHSNHLLRMTLDDGSVASDDISIFAFQQREGDGFLVRPLVSEHHDALTLLGVQNASVLLAQCGIWVEGITDRYYLRAYLNAYQDSTEFKKEKLKPMREDTHFAFWEYAGSNLAHYLLSPVPRKGTADFEEYDRGRKDVLAKIQSSALCNRIFLVADRDKGKEKKHSELRAVASGRVNFVYYPTPGVEIENLLSPEELKGCLAKMMPANQVVASATFAQADYKEERLGSFLEKELGISSSWVAPSGTLETYRKNQLSEVATDVIRWDTMSSEAKKLARALYQFLRLHNEV